MITLKFTHEQCGILRAALAGYIGDMEKIGLDPNIGDNARVARANAIRARDLSVYISKKEVEA